MTFDTTIPQALVKALSAHNLVKLLPDTALVNAVTYALRDAMREQPGFFNTDGVGNCHFGFAKRDGMIYQSPVTVTEPEGNRRVQIALCKLVEGVGGGLRLGDVCARIDIPLGMVTQGAERVGKYTIYNIRFNVNAAPDLDYDSCEPLRRGYVGITRRGALARYQEHRAKATTNTGSLLHTAWNALMRHHPGVYPVLQLTGHAASLEEAYAAEEKLVAEITLAPAGLNAIPGGLAGIRELHKLGALVDRGKLPNPDQRDYALAQIERNSPAAHYRRAHIRRLSPERTTFVNGCWVSVRPIGGAE